MDPSNLAFIKGVVAFILVAGTGMSGFWLWLRERRHGRPDEAQVVQALREENSAFHAELEARILELEERLDFAERRLMQAPKSDPAPQPRVTTPV